MSTFDRQGEELFYVKPEDVTLSHLKLTRDELHHLVDVCRKKIGDRFRAVDGEGHIFDCLIEDFGKLELRARIIKKTRSLGEPHFRLTTALALPRKSKFEWLIEKGTELGVSAFLPLLTERTVVSEKSVKTSRWTRIAVAAMKQSQRSVLPVLHDSVKLSTLCKNPREYDLRLLAHEKEEQNLKVALSSESTADLKLARNGVVCIGPEGGFTEAEVELAKQAGFRVFGMGARRLRAETAALVASALILEKMGELG